MFRQLANITAKEEGVPYLAVQQAGFANGRIWLWRFDWFVDAIKRADKTSKLDGLVIVYSTSVSALEQLQVTYADKLAALGIKVHNDLLAV